MLSQPIPAGLFGVLLLSFVSIACPLPAQESATEQALKGADFFERRVRPILVEHCYECHSEAAQESQGGLLLDRRSAWLKGGDTQAAVVPNNPESSLLIEAVKYQDPDLQMPPDGPLDAKKIELLERWVRMGAPGPREDLAESSFSRLGDQTHLAELAKDHWAFRPVQRPAPPEVLDAPADWNSDPLDRFVFAAMSQHDLTPSPRADTRTLVRRLYFDLTGLPPTIAEVDHWAPKLVDAEGYQALVEHLLSDPGFGEHFGRLWLDVARYADTDSFYRPDTRTPHYFPFAFTYRDYVIESFNNDKPYDQFVREQLAADLLGFEAGEPELAALGFLTVGPYANRNPTEALDDWIDVTTRGLMGITVACARCHDHKYEPVPTTDYYALRGVFNSVVRLKPLDEKGQPEVAGYAVATEDRDDYLAKRKAIAAKIAAADGKKAKNNNRSLAQKIRETELAELLLFHPGAPARTMIVKERPQPAQSFVFLRGDPARRGPAVQRRFLSVLDTAQTPFSTDNSGRLDLAERIVDPNNPLTARVFVNRVWGRLLGAHLVDTPSDFGLQGSRPSHPQLLDWLAAEFVDQGWSTKQLVRTIVASQTYQQASKQRAAMAERDPENRWLWRANRKHLSIESIRDGMLKVSGRLDRTARGRPAKLWGPEYTRRRSVYGYINRFNLDPTLRVFDFPTPMQSQPERRESIVAPQALFAMNSPFVIDQAVAITQSEAFTECDDDQQRARQLFRAVLQREPAPAELTRVQKFVESQVKFFPAPKRPSSVTSPWPLVAQSLLMSNEFQYVD